MTNITSQEKLFRFGLSRISGIGIKKYIQIVDRFDSAASFWKVSKSDLKDTFGEILGTKIYIGRDAIDIQSELEIIEKLNLDFKVFGEESFPYLLSQINDPPMCIFHNKGVDFSILDKSITIVGTRNSTNYAENILRTFIPNFINKGFSTVSGLAMGVDEAVHRLTLKSNGQTIAVLGSSVDNPTPKTNINLYRKIIESGGIVISEEFPGNKVFSGNFPRRNRILAGLTSSTLVIEASERSGALITAHLAFDYNRNVYAVPGNLGQKHSIGCNKIIKQQKAKLIESVEDILEDMGFVVSTNESNSTPKYKDLTNIETQIITKLSINGSMHADKLLKIIDTSVSELLASLMTLEIKGHVFKNKNDEYSIMI